MKTSSLLLGQFEEALSRLKEALAQKPNEFIRDSAIQRFEFTFDLAWKTLKIYLEEVHGVLCASPKSCFREAYAQKIISYDEYWIDLTEIRNRTSHTYSKPLAEVIFSQLPKAVKAFEELLSLLKTKPTGK